MSKFLEDLEEKLLDKISVLPADRKLDRMISIYCNKSYKYKLENEITNNALNTYRQSNHSSINTATQIGGTKVRLVIHEMYVEPIIKAGYYDKGNN